VSIKKKRKVEDDDNSSKSKKRKVVQDEPSLKKEIIDELEIDKDDDNAIDSNAMQTRMRTGTISKVSNFLLSYVIICNHLLEHTSTSFRRYGDI